jgi:sialic acid synthase SpsE
MNLAFLSTLRSAFGLPIGLSDHTESSLASAMAIALGATWIEKHFTLDRKADGFDHAYAMDPPKLTAFIADLRQASAALEPQAEKVGPSEAIVRGRARRALYAARDLSPGQILTERDVLVVRPEGPLSPGDLPKILGRPLAQAVPRLAPFELGSVCWSDAPVSTQPQLARQL